MIKRTSLGYRIFPDVTYRYVTVSGTTHVEEYVRSCSVWVYLGTI
jgi:TRAP-type C4-dicarboxylate transport system permease small subunit